MAKHLILFLAADPAGTDRLALDEECAAIERELSMTAGREDFDFRSKWAVSVDDLVRHLNTLAPTVIHFSGHGGGAAGLMLQEDGIPQTVPPRALTLLIKAAAASTRVVVLNACFSAAQAEALSSVVDCVVGMDGNIGDDAARSFAVAFYRALGHRHSVGNAVDQGVAILAAKQLPEAAMPRCRTRGGLDANTVVLGRCGPAEAAPSHRRWIELAALTATVVLLIAFVTISFAL
jgi:hypothetical protein